jgi:hypothetical protein
MHFYSRLLDDYCIHSNSITYIQGTKKMVAFSFQHCQSTTYLSEHAHQMLADDFQFALDIPSVLHYFVYTPVGCAW